MKNHHLYFNMTKKKKKITISYSATIFGNYLEYVHSTN